MKKLFFSLVALMCATISYAQSSLIATLSHDGEISTFYGSSALREAHEAAQHGDIITLSSGSFTSVNITKAITLRGAGMQVDTLAKTNPTIITGDFEINIPDSVEQRLTVEGLYINDIITVTSLNNASFLKDRIKNIHITGNSMYNSSMNNITFIHCKISAFYNTYNGNSGSNSASFVNCYVTLNGGGTYNYEYNRNMEFTNCYVRFGYTNHLSFLSFYNCIIYATANESSEIYHCLSSNCVANYCLAICSYDDLFKNVPNNTSNSYLSGNFNTLFKTYTGNYTDEETFELTDEAKAKYLGSDGTEVGIHGGSLPFDPTPTNPQITKCNVASKSTADGKLSVDIEVSATE
ncbi:MAG: hypothetical protein IJL54_01320 [Prevotella sp.]|nr:hypothetical protein [Prevotella sp.]